MRAKAASLHVLACCLLLRAAGASVDTSAPELAASSDTTTTFAASPAVGGAAQNAVVVWQQLDTAIPANRWDIYARRYDSTGSSVGAPIVVAASTACERSPAVAVDPAGNFLVVWEADGTAIKARFVLANGTLVGSEMFVNTTGGDGTHRKLLPAVAAVPIAAVTGTPAKFLVAWQSEGQPSGDTSAFAVMGRILSVDVAGAPTAGAEFLVNQTTLGSQAAPAVAYAPAFRTYTGYTGDRFVVAWQSDGGAAPGVYYRRVRSDGTFDGSEVAVSAAGARTAEPAIAADASGDFTIAWRETRTDGAIDVKFHRYPTGIEKTANAAALRRRTRPAVAAIGSGDFAITWDSEPQDPDGRGIYASVYDVTTTAIPTANEVPINGPVTTGDQEAPRSAASYAGYFLTAWQSALAASPHTGIKARLVRVSQDFYTLTPCRLLDTRVSGGGGPIAANGYRAFALPPSCGIPATARALSLNVTVANAGAPGSLVAYPGSTGDLSVLPTSPVPETWTLSFATGITRANNSVMQLAADGSGVLSVKLLSASPADLVIDVNGYFQ